MTIRLIRVFEGRDYPLRRSRECCAIPVAVPGLSAGLLACGAEQKAGFCLSRRATPSRASQHIGDLKHLETLDCYRSSCASFAKLFDFEPRAVACDLHPDYLSTGVAEALAREKGIGRRPAPPRAHMLSCMADNGLSGECLGLVWDGTGYGTDGAIWGGELLAGGAKGFRRLGTIRPIPLPGGDAATKEIWRTAEASGSRRGLK